MALDNIIKPSTSEWRRQLFLEVFINSQNKVTKISDDSVLSGFAGGIARVAGKAEKDIFIALSSLFPDLSHGELLDQVAENFGIAPRFVNQGSSVFIRITATPGTLYQAGIHDFESDNGLKFSLTEDVIVPDFGYTYAKVYSLMQGAYTNISPFSINRVTPQPSGHIHVVNEFQAQGGYDRESDETFKIRIKNGANILAKGTLAALEQVFMTIDNRVLRIFHHGIDFDGKTVIAIATQNGADLTQSDLDNILVNASPYFSLSDYRPWGREFYGIRLKNIEYQPIDISFRVELDGSRLIDEIRQDIQSKIGRMLDFRTFNPITDRVEWDDILHICKSTVGVKYVPDQFFYPRADIQVDLNKLPRLRGFLMLDIEGNVLSNMTGTLSPIYYPQQADFIYQSQFLREINGA